MAHLTMHSVSLLALCICALAASGKGEVIELTDLNFDEHVTRGGVWFIDVYAPWWATSTHKKSHAYPWTTHRAITNDVSLTSRCSHCRELEPVWQEVARQLDGIVNVGKVRTSSSMRYPGLPEASSLC